MNLSVVVLLVCVGYSLALPSGGARQDRGMRAAYSIGSVDDDEALAWAVEAPFGDDVATNIVMATPEKKKVLKRQTLNADQLSGLPAELLKRVDTADEQKADRTQKHLQAVTLDPIVRQGQLATATSSPEQDDFINSS